MTVGRAADNLPKPEQDQRGMNFRAEQVRLLFSGMPSNMLGMAAIAALVAFVLWPVVDAAAIVIWLACLALVLGGRCFLWSRWRRRRAEAEDHDRWLKLFQRTTVLIGLTWTLGSVLIFPTGAVPHQAFLALAVATITAAATNNLSPDRISAAVLIVPTVVPMTARLFLEKGSVPHAMGVVLAIYVPYAFAAVQRSHKRLAENFRLRAEAVAQARQLQRSARDLRETEAHLSSISANLAGVAIYRLAFPPMGRVRCTFISPNVEAMLGVAAPELQKNFERVFDLIEPEAVPATRNAMAEYLRTGGTSSIEIPLRHVDGRRRWIKFQSHLSARLPDGTQIRDGIAVDITATRETESQLEAYRQRLELALDAAGTCTWENDMAAGLITLDARWPVMLGAEPRETRATALALLRSVHPGDRADVFAAAARLADPSHNDYQVEQRVRSVRGDWLWIESRGRVVQRRPDGRPLRVIGVNTDVSVHKTAAETLERRIEERSAALTESERRHRTLLGNLQGMAYRCLPDEARTMRFVSDGSVLILGLTPDDLVSGRVTYASRIHPEDTERVRRAFHKALRAHLPCQVEYRVRHADGTWRWVWEQGRGIHSETGEASAIEGYITDISERVMLERQTNRAQRLESIGTLAGGIAHDLNNALAPILAGVSLLEAADPDDRETVRTIEDSAKRGADMVRRLLAFARGAEGERVAIQPAALFEELERIIRSTFPKNIELSIKAADDLPAMMGDPTQMHQVLLNLCVNARDAMPDGGTLALAASIARIDRSSIVGRQRQQPEPGRYVLFQVTDTGTGIAPGIIDRIFDPFFTTKPADKGSGLGLSSVMGLTEAHGGFVDVTSEPGHGSIFSVYVPASDGEPGDAVAPARAASFRGNGEAVLYVDDEAAVRTIVARVLERLNFIPLLAAGGSEGLEIAEANHASLRAVITDLDMPAMDGLAFAQALRARHPSLPVIVASGHLQEHQEAGFRKIGVSRTLDKPFTPDALANALRAVLTSA